MRILAGFCAVILTLLASAGWAQSKGPSIPTGGLKGMKGAAGAGFVDFTTAAPADGFKLDRGVYVAASIERPFGFLNLSLVLSISHMNANGEANYRYSKNGTNYSADGLAFRAQMFDLGLGLKWKAFEDYWFRPYIGGGGLGGYHEISYSSTSALTAQGSEFKTKDTVMSAGYYGEGGVEIEFTERFGVQLAARLADYSSKSLETLGGQKLLFRTETYYFSALIGF